KQRVGKKLAVTEKNEKAAEVGKKMEIEEQKEEIQSQKEEIYTSIPRKNLIFLKSNISKPSAPKDSFVAPKEPDAAKPSTPIVEEKKSSLPVRPATKAEQMRELKTEFNTLLTYVKNVATNPNEDKFCKIRLTN
ncbi:hypothetical protein LOK49_LG13G00212, partial [Camellia lanceoleosa]